MNKGTTKRIEAAWLRNNPTAQIRWTLKPTQNANGTWGARFVSAAVGYAAREVLVNGERNGSFWTA
jgi:hypothetical protein